MSEASVEWHDDFQLDATGDLVLSSGDTEVRQRLERRLFTAVQGYVWHPEYGAGLPQKIGSPWSRSAIQAIVAAQLQMEASVAPNPPAILTVAQLPNSLDSINIDIQYWDAVSGVSVSFTITT